MKFVAVLLAVSCFVLAPDIANSYPQPDLQSDSTKSSEKCKETRLHEAVRWRDPVLLTELVKKGNSVYATDCKDRTPMHLAVEIIDDSSVRALVRNRFDVNRRFKDGRTVLMHAAVQEPTVAVFVIDTLCKVGARVDATDDHGRTALLDAALNGRTDAATTLVKRGANLNKRFSKGNSYLHIASNKDDFDLVKLFAELGASVDLVNDDGDTPISMAVKNNNPAIINYLTRRGGNLSLTDAQGNTYLHTAVKENSIEALLALIENDVSPLQANNKGETPFALSIDNNNTKAMDILLENNNIINKLSTAGKNCLHEAVEKNSNFVVQKLLEKGVPVDILTINNETALSIAIKQDNKELSEILINYKADLQKRTEEGMTYGRIAIGNKASKSTQALKSHGYTEANVDDRDSYGHNAIYYAVKEDDTDKAAVLADLGADLNQVYGGNNFSLLHAAAREGSARAAKWLMGRGISVNITTTNISWTPLHYAANGGHVSVVDLLLESGACLDCRTSFGSTPLHLAARYGHVSVVKALLDKGACVDCKDNAGETALVIAMQPEVVDLLRSHGAH